MFNLDRVFLLGIIGVASFIEFWAAIAICIKLDDKQLGQTNTDCKDEWAWAVVAGLIGTLVTIVCFILDKFKPALLEGVVGWIMYFLLFGTWLCGVAVCTMDKPFAPQGNDFAAGATSYESYGHADNGYFATWIAFVFSTFLFFGQVTPVAEMCTKVFGELDDAKKMLCMICGASLIEMWHAARICDHQRDCAKMLAWGVCAGAISFILTMGFLVATNFVAAFANFTKYFAAFLALWWIAAVCTLTMPNGNSYRDCDNDDPYCVGLFLSVSNGFVGTWLAMLLSVSLVCMQFGVEVPGFKAQESGPTGSSNTAPPSSAATPPHEHTHEEPQQEAGVVASLPDDQTRA